MVRKRQAEFLAGRICAHHCLAQLGHGACKVGAGIDGLPLWPAGSTGAISHSGAVAMAAVMPVADPGSGTGIGIDVEHCMPARTADALCSRIATAGELDRMQARAGPPLSFAQAVTLIFSAKESIFKCLYPANLRFFGFHAVCLLERDGGCLHFAVLEPIGAAHPPGAAITVAYAIDGAVVTTWCRTPDAPALTAHRA